MADNDDIPFNRDFPLKPGVVEQVRPGVRRVLCNNPSPFTFTGTVSYIVGRGQGRDHRSRPGRRGPCEGAARCRARRDGDAHLRHPHPQRPLAEHAADQGRHRREGLCRRSAPRLAAALREREAHREVRRRPRFQARRRGSGDGEVIEGDGLVAGSGGDAGPHRQSLAFAWREAKDPFRRRSRDGLVDLDRRAAGRLDDRLHGVAGKAPQRDEDLYFSGHGPEIPDAQRYVRFLHPPSQGARGLDPASPRQGRGRHPDHRARDLHRHRSAADRARPAIRCSRIWRIWSRAGWWRPTAIRRSTGTYRLAGADGLEPDFCASSPAPWSAALLRDRLGVVDRIVDVLDQFGRRARRCCRGRARNSATRSGYRRASRRRRAGCASRRPRGIP